ncbi:hypothetical protein C8Q77DRAFT_89327 [Trametes polyzona]|nr:hypothetical protein C8Q77DRAFT_89327 [Trametes polyzona]
MYRTRRSARFCLCFSSAAAGRKGSRSEAGRQGRIRHSASLPSLGNVNSADPEARTSTYGETSQLRALRQVRARAHDVHAAVARVPCQRPVRRSRNQGQRDIACISSTGSTKALTFWTPQGVQIVITPLKKSLVFRTRPSCTPLVSRQSSKPSRVWMRAHSSGAVQHIPTIMSSMWKSRRWFVCLSGVMPPFSRAQG